MTRLRLAAFFLPVLIFAQTARKIEPRKLVVIYVSGLDARLLSQPVSRLKIPNIRKLMREGAVAAGVVGVAPSDTISSLRSFTTGALPDEAGTTLWEAAAKAGLKTAAVYWPETGRGGLAFDFPESKELSKDPDVPFESVARLSSPAGIINAIDQAAPGFQKTLWDDASTARAASWLVGNRKADLVLVQLAGVESEQFETTAFGIYAREALENDDELIGQILAATPAGTIVAIVSGHGVENENYIVRPRTLLKGARIEVKDGLIGTEDRMAAARLRQLMKDGRRHGIAREVPMAEVKSKAPELAKWVAAFDTPPNYVASNDESGPAIGPGSHRGIGGLWPGRPGYRSIFAIAGAGISPRKMGEIDLLQIAPTLADVMGVKLPDATEGSLRSAIFR